MVTFNILWDILALSPAFSHLLGPLLIQHTISYAALKMGYNAFAFVQNGFYSDCGQTVLDSQINGVRNAWNMSNFQNLTCFYHISCVIRHNRRDFVKNLPIQENSTN